MRRELPPLDAKCLALLAILVATPLSADPEWITQQSARLVVGQPSFTRQSPISSRSIIGSAGGVAVGGDRLFIAEGNRIGATPINNRVLIYHDLNGIVPEPTDELEQNGPCPACIGTPDVVLGQTDFESFDFGVQNGMRAPSSVATDGRVLAVADTNNNRVMLWNQIPATNGAAPDVVLGQPDAGDNTPRTSANGMRGPQGVWVADGKLFVADTQNSRILIWNSIPSASGANADVVVGQPDFDTAPEPDLTRSNFDPAAAALLDPVSVTVNNGRMFVADLGFDRVLIYNTVPTSNGAGADVVIGQPDMTTAGFNEDAVLRSVAALCEEIGIFEDDGSVTPDDSIFPPPIDREPPAEGEPTTKLPRRCERTLNFPRFALSDGEKLFIADSGNDRVLIFNQIPTENGAAADLVIGQPDFISLEESVQPGNVRSPTSLAHDGTNLYVADPFTRRILIFSEAENMIAHQGIQNGASFSVQATGFLQYTGTAAAGQTVSVELSGRSFELETADGETSDQIRDKIMEMINSDPDTLVRAHPFNGAGRFARGFILFGGGVIEGETIGLTLGDKRYNVIVQPGDTAERMVDRFVFEMELDPHPLVISRREITDINTLEIIARTAGDVANSISMTLDIPAGSPLTAERSAETLTGGEFPHRVRLTALPGGRRGNAVTITALVTGAGLAGSTSGSRLVGGGDARFLPNGTFAAIFGEDMSAETLVADASQPLPTELGGVQVYCNGRLAPIFSVSPNQVNFMVPWEIEGTGSTTYVRRTLADGSVKVSVPRGNEITRAAPGLFAMPGIEPRQAVAVHGAAQATGTVAISRPAPLQVGADETEVLAGSATATITINNRNYTYDAVAGQTVTEVRDRLIDLINAGDGDPDVVATAGRIGFFSARANVDFTGDPVAGNVVTLRIGNRGYTYTVLEGDTLEVIRNVLVDRVNSGLGDPEVTARRLILVGQVTLQVVARALGTDGNSIPFSVEAMGGGVMAVTNVAESGVLEGGQTPPVVLLTARRQGREGNEITYSGDSSDTLILSTTGRSPSLCCGNIPFSLITEDNPAIPGELIIVFGSGLGFPSPLPDAEGLLSGHPTPAAPLFNVPFNADDFVSSLAGGRTASLRFAGLMPGFPGIYQINLQLNEGLADDPATPLTIAQVLFISNTVTIPVKNLRPSDPDDFDSRF